MRTSRRLIFPFAVLLVAVLFLPRPSRAQSTATIHGRITDPAGAVIAGALIGAFPATGNNQVAETHSDAEGQYSIAVPAGRYRITTSSRDFSDASNEIALAAGASDVLDVRMQLATMSSNVIVSAEAQPQPADDVVSPVDVLTRADIANEGQVWLTPLLATVPGVSFSQLGPMGGTTSLFLDGGNSNYTRVLVDGVPADVSLSGISFDLSNYTTDSIDKVEVVHGASSALYGSDAMTGVVEILTHRGSTKTPAVTLEGEGGTFDTDRGSGQVSGLVGPLDYSVGGGYFSSRGQSPGAFVLENDGPQTFPYFRDTTLSGNFGWKFSDTNTLRLTLRNSASDAGDQGQTLLSTPSNIALLGFDPVSPGEHIALHNFSSGLSWDLQPNDRWQNHLQAYDSRFQDNLDAPAFAFTSVSKFNRAGFDERLAYLFHNGAVTTGYSFEAENGATEGRHDQAGYVEVRYQLTRRLAAVVGARVEGNTSFSTHAIPRVGAAYTLREANGFLGVTKLRTSYGQGIKEPPLFPSGCTPILKPEQSGTFDAGFDQYFASDRVRLSSAFFYNSFRNVVSFEFGNANPNCGAFGGSFFNTDKARAFGNDSSFAIRATRWLDVAGTYSYDDSKVLASPNAFDPALIPGNRLLKRPLNSANLLVNVHYHRVNWNLTGNFVGRRTDSDFLGLGITSNPGYVRWDTATSVPLCYGVTLTAHIQNLFDKHYSDAVGYPALGYNYRLGLRYTWGGAR